MGLQNQLNDVSSDSIPLLLVSLIANYLAYLRSFLFGLISRFAAPSSSAVDDGLLSSLASGLTGMIVLAEQLKLNRAFSYRYCRSGEAGSVNSKCVVCRSKMRDGQQVRKLDCLHVFHKECFDGWLHHLNFNCPLCRKPLVCCESVESTRRRVGGDLIDWFCVR